MVFLLIQGAGVREEQQFSIPEAIRRMSKFSRWDRPRRPQNPRTLKPGQCPRCSDARHFGRCRKVAVGRKLEAKSQEPSL